MKYLNPYLIFNGNCRQAMEFYKECLDGVLFLSTYAEMPGAAHNLPQDKKNWIIHARLTIKSQVLMASDTQPNMPVTAGDNFFVSINVNDIKEAEQYFKALGKNAKIDMPLQETPWAIRFGMLTDQFGIKWMINLEKSKN